MVFDEALPAEAMPDEALPPEAMPAEALPAGTLPAEARSKGAAVAWAGVHLIPTTDEPVFWDV